jgi:Holliday junction resolvase RusA-like endonuclease
MDGLVTVRYVEKQTATQGPLMCVIELDRGLLSKSNFRRGGPSSEWRRQKGFEDEVALAAKLARPKGWPKDDGSVGVAERWGYVVLIVAHTMIDTANMAKSVTDALEGVLYFNDASVRACASVSMRGRAEQSATVIVGALAPGSGWAATREMGEVLFKRYEELHDET